MKNYAAKAKPLKNRKNERGAALVMVLMITFLLFTAVAALLLEASGNTANVTDATSEEQAYYASESGIQSVVDILRSNPRPNPLIDPSKSPYPPDPDADEANQIEYLKAVTRETSNQCTKAGVTFTCADPLDQAPNDLRLSRWLPYNWGPIGGAAAASKDRIVLGNPNTYNPARDFAYSVKVSDPDFTDGRIRYTVAGDLDLSTSGFQASKQFFGANPATDWTTITYTPPAAQEVDVMSGSGIGSLGSFTVSTAGAGGTIPTGSAMPRYKIVLSKSGAQPTTVVFRGYIITANTTIEKTPTGSCTMAGISYLFDSQYFAAFGSRLEIADPDPLPAGSPAVCQVEERKDNSSDTGNGPEGIFLAGWRLLSAAATQPLNLKLKISKPHPTRLLIKSTGYGPRGSRKELESIIQKNYFDGLGAPSPLTMIGPNCTLNAVCADFGITLTSTNFMFSPGNSRPIFYTGKDRQLRYFLPPIGGTNDTNTNLIKAATGSGFNGAVYGTPENLLDELPPWLQTPTNLHQKVLALREEADSSGSYWLGDQNGVPVGNYLTGKGITFIDGNLNISPSQDGGGILVVNGKITNNGGYSFKGLILVIGQGGMDRQGGGSATLEGNMVIAPYMSPGRRILTAFDSPMEKSLDCSGPITSPQTTALTNRCFYAPKYSISGGGGSDVMYNSQSVSNGLSGLGNFVKGVAEK